MTREDMLTVAKIYHKDTYFSAFNITCTSEIACYQENGKYYIRICKCNKLSRLYHEPVYSTFTKEFTDVNYANNYFKKISSGYKRVN